MSNPPIPPANVPGGSFTAIRFPAQSRQAPVPATLPAELRQFLRAQQHASQQDWATIGDVVTGMVMVGPLAQQPSAGNAGRFYFATDSNKLFVDNGQAWIQVN